jgi:hypothetical protein
MQWKNSMRAAVASVTAAAFLLAGCSKAVRVPDNTLKPSTEWKGLYQVRTTTDQFTTRSFSITDSTLVISRLCGSDEHFGKIQLPVTIMLADVRSVDRLENDNSRNFMVVGGILLVGIGIFVALVMSDAFAIE